MMSRLEQLEGKVDEFAARDVSNMMYDNQENATRDVSNMIYANQKFATRDVSNINKMH